MRKIVLIGGNGFIGEYLNKLLKKRKDCEVVIVGRKDFLKSDACKNTEVIVILTQPDQEVLKEIISFISSSKTLKKVIYLSTILLYPDSSKKQNEQIPPEPKTTYEKSKYQEELLLSKVAKKARYKLCIARLANVYGDVKNKGIINNILLFLIKKNKNLVIQGDPRLKIRDYIFIEDAVNLLEFLIFYKKSKKKEVFNVSTGIGSSVKELIEKIELAIGKRIHFKTDDQILEKLTNIGENSKLLDQSKYQFRYGLIEGLKKTYKNYLKSYLV